MKKKVFLAIGVLVILASVFIFSGCSVNNATTSDVKRVTSNVEVNDEGMTTEQSNIKERLEEDNALGSIKHLYVISAYSGDVILYSTVKGKVTSSGKRLTPLTSDPAFTNDVWVPQLHESVSTGEVMQEDGTYGSSIEYLYWWDTKGDYHQHYPTGGQIIHISTQPLVVPKVIINISSAD